MFNFEHKSEKSHS